MDSLSLSDITHVISTIFIFGIIALYFSGEWRIYIICFAMSYVMYIIYYNFGLSKKTKSLAELKKQDKKKKNVLTMLKLDEINLVKQTKDD